MGLRTQRSTGSLVSRTRDRTEMTLRRLVDAANVPSIVLPRPYKMPNEGDRPDYPGGPEAVRAQLKRIVESDLFSRGPRQCRFLTYVVEATITGNGTRLNQIAIGFDVFDRGRDFDPSTDAIVRVEAGRPRRCCSE